MTYVTFGIAILIWISTDTLWDPTNNIGIFTPRKLKFRFLIENPDQTFINKMWTEGIK
jgi:hypothetical protein